MQLLALPTVGKLLAALAVAVPVVVAGGYAYKSALGCTWGQVRLCTCGALNPGA